MVSPTREGLNLAGRTRPSVVWSRSDEADWLSLRAAIIVAEKEWLLRPLRTARNRRTRTRMYGGVGAGRGNPPGDPIRRKSPCCVPFGEYPNNPHWLLLFGAIGCCCRTFLIRSCSSTFQSNKKITMRLIVNI